MKRFLIAALAGVAVLGALLAVQPQPARAATQLMCAPNTSGNAPGPRQVVNTSSAASPQPTYTLNGAGCAIIAQADVGFFLSQGYTGGPMFMSVVSISGVIATTVAAPIAPLPPGMFIRDFIVENTTANAVTGGIAFCSALTSTACTSADVVAALTCAANCLTFVADAALLKRVFSKTASQALWVQGVTAGNNANLTITMVYAPF